jgi:hypothetical protein
VGAHTPNGMVPYGHLPCRSWSLHCSVQILYNKWLNGRFLFN